MLKQALFLTLSVLLLAGCGSDGPAVSPALAQAGPPGSTREAHVGQVVIAGQAEPARLAIEFERVGNAIEGIGRLVIGDTTVLVGPLTGTDDGESHNFTVDFRPGFPVMTFSGDTEDAGFTGTLSGGAAAQALHGATYQTQSGAPTVDSAPFAGRYTITLSNGDVLYINATSALNPDANAPDVEGLANTVVAYLSADPGGMDPTNGGTGTYVAGTMVVRLNQLALGDYLWTSAVLEGTLSSGRGSLFTLVRTPPVQQVRYTMVSGFPTN